MAVQTAEVQQTEKSEWKPIPGTEDCYEVDQYGHVKSLPRLTLSKQGWYQKVRGGTLRPITDSKGYIVYSVSVNGVIWRIWAHRAVVEAFIGLIPYKMEVNHKDGIKKNNYVDNLEIVTTSQNRLHSFHVLGNKAATREAHGSAKLNCQSVLEIRNKYVPFIYTIKQLADEYSVGYGTIQAVVTGRTWKPWQ